MSCPHNYDARFIIDNIEDPSFNKYCKNCGNLYYENGKTRCKSENSMQEDNFKFDTDIGCRIGYGYYSSGYIVGSKSNNNPDKFQEPSTTAEEFDMLKQYALFLGRLDVTTTQK